MSEWIEASLAQLVSFQKGKKVETSPEPQPGFLKYLGASGIEGKFDGYASPVGGVMAKPSDMLMLWDGERSGLVGFGREGVVASTVTRLSIKTDIEAKFLYYLLADRFEWIQNRRTGTGVPHVPKDIGRMLLLRFPRNLRAQKRIAVFLSSIDSAIEKTESLIEKYQHIKAGLMYDLFTRGVLPNGQLRPRREEAPELYKETVLGWLPKDWHISNCGAEFDVESGITLGPHRRPDQRPKPYLRVANVYRGELRLNDVAELEMTASDAGLELRTGDILMVEGHANRLEIARCAMVTPEAQGFLFQNHLFRLRPRVLRNEYSILWLNSHHAIKYWDDTCSSSSGLNTINRRMLEKLPISCPSENEQIQITEKIAALAKKLESESLRLNKLQSQKSGLMQDLLTGKVPVPVPEHEATDG